jgi:hypothetical protein
MNWKGCGMSQICPYCTIPVFSWSNKQKPQKLRISSVLAKIHTWYIPISAKQITMSIVGNSIERLSGDTGRK